MLNAKTLIKQRCKRTKQLQNNETNIEQKGACHCLSNVTNRGTQCRSNAKYLFLQNCYLENIIDKLNNIAT